MIKKYIFIVFWALLVVFLLYISLQYRSRTEAMVAVVESQTTAISYQKPVIIEALFIVPGQEVKQGDTLLIVSRPDLSLDIDKKVNELERLQSQLLQTEQSFNSRSTLIRIETEGTLNRRSMELAELETKLKQQKSVSIRLKDMVGNENGSSFSDSLLLMKMKSVSQEMADIKTYSRKEIDQLSALNEDEKELLKREIEITKRELDALNDEKNSLIKRAGFDGIVGTVNIQLDELVPPYKSILSLYEFHPTLIKAYMNESVPYPIKPGDRVSVVSENRLYSINGLVLELGARITDFPDKIQPTNGIRSYGQEIFIRIPGNNRFLNGEKVFVYPIVLE